MNPDPRIPMLEGAIAILSAGAGYPLNPQLSSNLWRFVIWLKNSQNMTARQFADSSMFAGDEKARQEFLDTVATLESVLEHLETIPWKAPES